MRSAVGPLADERIALEAELAQFRCWWVLDPGIEAEDTYAPLAPGSAGKRRYDEATRRNRPRVYAIEQRLKAIGWEMAGLIKGTRTTIA